MAAEWIFTRTACVQPGTRQVTRRLKIEPVRIFSCYQRAPTFIPLLLARTAPSPHARARTQIRPDDLLLLRRVRRRARRPTVAAQLGERAHFWFGRDLVPATGSQLVGSGDMCVRVAPLGERVSVCRLL